MTNTPQLQTALEKLDHALSEVKDAHYYTRSIQHDGMTPQRLGIVLRELNWAHHMLNDATGIIIRAARDAEPPTSWAVIGEALGMSRQAAWEKYEGGPLSTDVL